MLAAELNDLLPALKKQRRSYADQGKVDQVWCVASALAYLKQADADEQQFFGHYRGKGLARVKSRLTEDLLQWSVSEEYFELRSHLGLTIG